jgi:hypothetical protein
VVGERAVEITQVAGIVIAATDDWRMVVREGRLVWVEGGGTEREGGLSGLRLPLSAHNARAYTDRQMLL